jgi:hypothetical protein
VTPGSEEDDIGDACVYHVQLEHQAGCPTVSYTWARRAFGAFLCFIGFILAYLRQKSQKWFMAVIVQMTVLLVLLAFFMSQGYLAVIDPTEPPKRKSVIMGVVAICVALIAAFVARWLFKRFLKFGPTVIGMGAGYMVTIYSIITINGVCSVFQARNAEAVIGENGQILYALAGIIVGAWVGYNYAFIFILAVQCFVSAYLTVRGLSLWINYGFPNEAKLIEHAYGTEQGPPLEIPQMFYFYLTLIFALWIGTFYYAWTKAHEYNEKQTLEDSD